MFVIYVHLCDFYTPASTGLMILRTIFGFFNAEKLKQKFKTAFGAL